MNFDWKKLVGTVAPALGTALGGPLVGIAVKSVATALGLEPEATQEQVATKLAGATPADLLALKLADQQFAKDMRALDVDLERIAVQDRDSARGREIAVRDNTNRNMAYAYTIGYFGLLAAVLLYGVKPEVETLVNVLIGILSASQAAIMGYYFGSSKSSSDKNALMATKYKSTP
jgi:hypothetical protein